MRIVFIGVSHWHAPLYYGPAARLAGVEIVGVSDPDVGVAERGDPSGAFVAEVTRERPPALRIVDVAAPGVQV